MIATTVLAVLLALVAASLSALGLMARRRCLDRWLVSYVIETPRRRIPRRGEPKHLILCIADHHEPRWGRASPERARARVRSWTEHYPQLFGAFVDSDGRPPRHTFFYPLDEYEPEHVDALADLCRAGFGEVEIHLHHDDDTPENLRRTLLHFKAVFDRRHGLLSRNRFTGELAYAFAHGNWALDNSRPDGRWCGVNNELDILRETGCYADFTLPSVPNPTQTRKINSIYYACDDPCRPRSHDWGTDVGTAPQPPESLMLIQGPLVLDWVRRKWGVLPHIESGCIQASQPAQISRVNLWLKARIQVPARPDWFFVKLYTHGAPEANRRVLLGAPMVEFHRALARRAAQDPTFHYHYVTAREMYNLVRAAEALWRGSVAEARDFRLVWDGRAASADASIKSPSGSRFDSY